MAVEQDGGALEYVPERLRTEELCRIAVKEDRGALEYVPKSLKTREFFRRAQKTIDSLCLDL